MVARFGRWFGPWGRWSAHWLGMQSLEGCLGQLIYPDVGCWLSALPHVLLSRAAWMCLSRGTCLSSQSVVPQSKRLASRDASVTQSHKVYISNSTLSSWTEVRHWIQPISKKSRLHPYCLEKKGISQFIDMAEIRRMQGQGHLVK
jgi:hypothetical protein